MGVLCWYSAEKNRYSDSIARRRLHICKRSFVVHFRTPRNRKQTLRGPSRLVNR